MLMKQSKMQFQEIQISSLDNGCPEQLRIEKNLKSGSYFLPLSEETGEGDKKSSACFPLLCTWVLCMEGCPNGISVMRWMGLHFENFIPIHQAHSCCYRDERKPR